MRPIITQANPLISYKLKDKYLAILLNEIKAPQGYCQYAYILQVLQIVPSENNSEKPEFKPLFCVTSEVALQLPGLPSPGSHVLGAFTQNSHRNYGFSDKWGNLDEFLPKSLSLAKELLKDESISGEDWLKIQDCRPVE
jgi:hypothetical protein